MRVFEKILINILDSLYQTAIFSLIVAILFMFAYIGAKEKGWKSILKIWIKEYKKDICFRRIFCLAFYTSMILFRTLFNRGLWLHPLSNVIGNWGIYNANGEVTTEVIENLILFVPFTFLYTWVFKERLLKKCALVGEILLRAMRVTFLVSFTIEFLQLFLRVGTFQLSDLFYNTLGGFAGGLIYWIAYKIVHRKNKKKNIN